MLIYNTLTRKKEEFTPINPPNVNMYVCGPTVYDYFHIGNARSFIMADVIRKYLEYKGYNVKYVMNLTDVDDKIIKKSNEEGVEAGNVADKYSKAFMDDITRLKIKPATVYPKATEHMDEIVGLVKKLEENGAAYNVDGNVFFNVNNFKGYGKLSGKKTDELEVGARIEINDEKENPLDFSLWKKAKPNEPAWDSPWGGGRPGWHIECSAMSMKHLGETIDIHAGGNDLIFPHHENEIAQSEAATHKDFVKYWMHFGFLNINQEKMSKSLGNFFTAREVLKKYPAEALRLLYTQTHYGGPLAFSEDLLASAAKGSMKLKNAADRMKEGLQSSADGDFTFDFDKFYSSFEAAMDDDFNSPKAVAVVYDFVKEFNAYLNANENPGKEFFNKSIEFMTKTADDVLGIVTVNGNEKVEEADSGLLDKLINTFIELRTEAKQNKNYALADSIRDKLKDIGVVLQDSKTGTTYKIEN
ncbi:MAG: cysteine--tRNA ligase [Melioribacteraceae bacterium]|nr:MAG: cysteine--tRNA ligase [Melioribacteraceae bacterium]